MRAAAWRGGAQTFLSFTWSFMEPRHIVIERGSLKRLNVYGNREKTAEGDRKAQTHDRQGKQREDRRETLVHQLKPESQAVTGEKNISLLCATQTWRSEAHRPSTAPPRIYQQTGEAAWQHYRSEDPCSSSATRRLCNPPEEDVGD